MGEPAHNDNHEFEEGVAFVDQMITDFLTNFKDEFQATSPEGRAAVIKTTKKLISGMTDILAALHMAKDLRKYPGLNVKDENIGMSISEMLHIDFGDDEDMLPLISDALVDIVKKIETFNTELEKEQDK